MNKLKGNGSGWLILPFLLLLTLFWLIPLFQGLIMSFQPDFPKDGETYSLFHNYSRIIQDKNFYKALTNNLIYTVSVIGILIPLSRFFSFILTSISSSRLRYFYLFCMLLPGLIPPSVMGILFNLTFNGRTGVLNQIFVIPLGFKPIEWLKDPHFIMPALVIQAVWRWAGFITLFFLCGMEAIPKSTKEAAVMDGSGPVKSFIFIEIPCIKHIILFCTAFLIVDTLSLFSGSYSLLGNSGGTANAGLVMANYSYMFTSFRQFNVASTVCILILPFLMLLTSIVCYRRKMT